MTRPVFLLFLFSSPVYAGLCSSAAWADSDRQGIVDHHNALRSSIAKGTYVAKTDAKPTATNMMKMEYDCTLENSAQTYINTCPTGHSNAPEKGENIYWSWSSAAISLTGKGVSASAAWEKEFQDYGWASNNFTQDLFNSGIGHATQNAWHNSNKVGCGVKTDCPSTMSAPFTYMIIVICQYTSQGNYINFNIYNSGTTCSACPAGTSCEASTGLCAPPTTTTTAAATTTVATTTAAATTTVATTTTVGSTTTTPNQYPKCKSMNTPTACAGNVAANFCNDPAYSFATRKYNCAQECGFCGQAASPCVDNHPQCNLYKSSGYCTSQPAMAAEYYCPATCGFCTNPN